MPPKSTGARKRSYTEGTSTCKPLRLDRLGRVSRVSLSGIAQLLEDVKDNFPAHFSRQTQIRARKRTCSTATPFGPLVQSLDSGGVAIPYQHPLAILWEATGMASYQALMARARVEGHHTLMIYADGVSPQDGLSKHDRRKLVVVYWSILQFDDALCGEDAWFPLAALRETLVASVPGGFSRVLRDLIRGAFFSDAYDARKGVHLQDDMRFVIDSLALLGDIPALAEMAAVKGHGAFKGCVICRNVVLRRWWKPTLVDCVDHTSLETHRFVLHTETTFREVISRIREAAPIMSSAEFEELQIVHGVHYVPHGLVFADDLGVTPLHFMNDWMHTYLVGGLADVELGLLMCELRARRSQVTYEAVGAYMRLWKWPRHIEQHGTSFAKLFDEQVANTHLEGKRFSCTSSEPLSLIPVLQLYFR